MTGIHLLDDPVVVICRNSYCQLPRLNVNVLPPGNCLLLRRLSHSLAAFNGGDINISTGHAV